mmetsp:Transcript_4158/g.8837  ORF Transcript_4158/g.8837 Transcript_4158/m.8837 type:complete len:278 (-) Transcript_4158:167-1000(-)
MKISMLLGMDGLLACTQYFSSDRRRQRRSPRSTLFHNKPTIKYARFFPLMRPITQSHLASEKKGRTVIITTSCAHALLRIGPVVVYTRGRCNIRNIVVRCRRHVQHPIDHRRARPRAVVAPVVVVVVVLLLVHAAPVRRFVVLVLIPADVAVPRSPAGVHDPPPRHGPRLVDRPGVVVRGRGGFGRAALRDYRRGGGSSVVADALPVPSRREFLRVGRHPKFILLSNRLLFLLRPRLRLASEGEAAYFRLADRLEAHIIACARRVVLEALLRPADCC